MPKSDDQAPDPSSRTQVKREMEALQKIGKDLAALPESELSRIDMPEDLRTAILFTHTLKSNEAKRRHLQYVGKLMRAVDIEKLKDTIAKIKHRQSHFTAQFHKIEKWCDQLIEKGDDALQEFIQAHPNADRQQLRQLIRNAKKDRNNQKNSGGEKTLFRTIQDIMRQH